MQFFAPGTSISQHHAFHLLLPILGQSVIGQRTYKQEIMKNSAITLAIAAISLVLGAAATSFHKLPVDPRGLSPLSTSPEVDVTSQTICANLCRKEGSCKVFGFNIVDSSCSFLGGTFNATWNWMSLEGTDELIFVRDDLIAPRKDYYLFFAIKLSLFAT